MSGQEPSPQIGTGRQPSVGPLASAYQKGVIPEVGKTVQQLTELDPYDDFKSTIPFVNGASYVVVVGAKIIRTNTDNTVSISVAAADGDIIDQFIVGFTTSGQSYEGIPRRLFVPPGATVTGIAGTILSLVRCYSRKWAVLAL